MPNHVINRITFTCDGDRLQQILSEICYDQRDEAEYGPGTLDFNKLKPMPESLSIESGTSTMDGVNLYLTAVNPSGAELGLKKLSNEEFQKLLSAFQGTSRFWSYNAELTLDEVSKCTSYRSLTELLNLGETAVNNKIRYGALTWYEWCSSESNWNTKWNSYDAEPYDGGDTISFATAWSPPHPVLEALSAKYPEVSILHRWADEDLGNNCGWAEYENGEVQQFTLFDGGQEALSFAEELWGFEPDELYDIEPDEPELSL